MRRSRKDPQDRGTLPLCFRGGARRCCAFGDALSKEEYLGTVESGDIDYVVWKPEAIDVRVSGDMAVLRYSSRIEIVVGGRRIPPGDYWHTDY
jgi:hypothetical protein